MNTDEAIKHAFINLTNEAIGLKLGVPYSTAASYRFKYPKGLLSLAKQVEILNKLNYSVKTELQWKKPVK